MKVNADSIARDFRDGYGWCTVCPAEPGEQHRRDCKALAYLPPPSTGRVPVPAKPLMVNGHRPFRELPPPALPKSDPAPGDSLLAGLRTGDWLDAQVFEPLRWAVPGLVPEGMSLLIGGPKIGKSWLALDIALAVASGGRALGHLEVGQPRPVLLLALEDGDRRLQERIRALIPGARIPSLFHYMPRIIHNMLQATIGDWLNTLDTGAGDPLVILDTLGKVMPDARPGQSPYQRDYKVSGHLKQICDTRPGMALLVLHHDRKAQAEDFVDSVSGTNGIAGAADTIVVLSRKRTEQTGLLQVTGRDVVEREYAVTVSSGRWRLAGESLDDAAEAAETVRATANLGDRQAEIFWFVQGHPDGVRAGEVAKAMGMRSKEAGVYLGRLLEAGKVRRPERGLYTPVVTVVSVGSGEGESPEDNSSNTSNKTSACAVCRFPLDPALTVVGENTHPNCDPSSAS